MPDVSAWIYYGGRLRVINVTGSAADADVDLQPPSGKRWLVLRAHFYHDDTSSRACFWSITDGTNTLTAQSQNQAANQNQQIYDGVSAGANNIVATVIMLNAATKAIANATSLGSGKKIYIQALVLEVDEQ